MLKDAGLTEFEPQDAASIADLFSTDETVKGLSEKQVNGLLRHLAEAGLLLVAEPGKRGKSGKMPKYKLPEEEANEKTG